MMEYSNKLQYIFLPVCCVPSMCVAFIPASFAPWAMAHPSASWWTGQGHVRPARYESNDDDGSLDSNLRCVAGEGRSLSV